MRAGTMETTMQRKFVFFFAATTLALAQGASADPNVEYADSYETAYLASCSADRSAAACQCSMEAIEDTLSFDAFATLVEHYGGNIRRALPAERLDPVLESRCGIATLSLPQSIDVTQRAHAPQ
jgi:hypothetical protein